MSPVMTILRPVRASPMTSAARTVRRPPHVLPALEPTQVGTMGDAELRGLVGVEMARALVLDNRVAVGSHAMVDRKGADLIAVVAHGLALLELQELELISDPAEDPAQRADQVPQAGRADQPQRQLPVRQVIRLQQAGDAEVVIGVVVADIDVLDRDQADRVLHLPLGALPAIEEQSVAAQAGEYRGGRPLRGRQRTTGPQEHDIEVHARNVNRRSAVRGRRRAQTREAPGLDWTASRP